MGDDENEESQGDERRHRKLPSLSDIARIQDQQE